MIRTTTVCFLLCTACGGSAPEAASSWPAKVACVGDSITAGSGASTPSKAYVADLQAAMTVPVDGFGHGGTTLESPAPAPWTAYVSQPEYAQALASDATEVVIALGTNDAWALQTGAATWDAPTWQASANSLANAFESMPSHPRVWFAVPPGGPMLANTLSSTVRPALEATGRPLIDLYTPTAGHPELFIADGVHPNDAGHLVLATTIADALAAK